MPPHLSKFILVVASALLGLMLAETLLAGGEPVEIRFRAASRTHSAIVRLGDLAEIHSTDTATADKWRTLPLFPAPAAGQTQAIPAREIQDVVALHYGADPRIRWGGAAEIRLAAVTGPVGPLPPSETSSQTALGAMPGIKPVNQSAEAAASTARLAAACETFLEKQSGRGGWQVRPRVHSKELAALGALEGNWRIAAVDTLATGSRRFSISLPSGSPLSIVAEVAQVATVVVATRGLPRGTMLSADQLALEPVTARTGEGSFAMRLDEVVGQELQQPVQAGQPIDVRQVRRPLLVRRGSPVLVIAWSAGVKVKTNGRVLSDGAKGDLVEVQAVDSNDRYLARVIEPRTVEVFAGVLSVPADGVREEPKAARGPIMPLDFRSE